jgi:hypothetical protein
MVQKKPLILGRIDELMDGKILFTIALIYMAHCLSCKNACQELSASLLSFKTHFDSFCSFNGEPEGLIQKVLLIICFSLLEFKLMRLRISKNGKYANKSGFYLVVTPSAH